MRWQESMSCRWRERPEQPLTLNPSPSDGEREDRRLFICNHAALRIPILLLSAATRKIDSRTAPDFYGRTKRARKNSPVGVDIFGPESNVVPAVAAKKSWLPGTSHGDQVARSELVSMMTPKLGTRG